MAGSIIYPAATCSPTYMSMAMGLPLGSCKATEVAMVRNAKGMARAAGEGEKKGSATAPAGGIQQGVRPRLNRNEGMNKLPSVESQNARLQAALEQQKKVRDMQAQQAAMDAVKETIG
jgi:hypothetical protein